MFLDETRWDALAAILPCAGFWSGAECTQQVAEADIQQLSIEQLASIEIISVSEAPFTLSTADAAIQVTSNDNAVRAAPDFRVKLLVLTGEGGAHCETRLRF